MIKSIINTQNYFQAPGNYFWRWGDNGEVLEWVNGSTICYRDDVIDLLKELSAKRLPSFSSILLLLSVCKKGFSTMETLLLLQGQKKPDDQKLFGLFEDTIAFLHIVNALPAELKTGRARMHLIHEVLYGIDFPFPQINVKDALDELNSGRIDNLVIQEKDPITKEEFTNDLLYFSNALKKYPSSESLALKLRTGLDVLPKPAEISLPEITTPDLLDQLAEDPKTVGISRLTRRLVAALNIPMHSAASGDQSYGGITDITNRGSYDKLLLSELAHDNDLLMARLVNNEALYFRREQPPDDPKRQRTILLDTTIKMWGIPKVFGLSAALAFTHNTRHNEIVESYALGGDVYTEVKLETTEGVIKSLELLDHSLHCGNALQHVINEFSTNEYNEFIFITEEKIFNTPAFHVAISEVKEALGFILTVSRTGSISFYECKRGRTKLISTAKLELDELLFAPPKIVKTKTEPPGGNIPAFLLQLRPPLLFPRVKIKLVDNRIFDMGNDGIVVINENQRVLFIPHKEHGAYELINYIEKGTYFFGYSEPGIEPDTLFILVNNFQRKFIKCYQVGLDTGIYSDVNLSDEIQSARNIVFKDNRFYIRTDYASFCYDCFSGQLIDKKNYDGFPEIFKPFLPEAMTEPARDYVRDFLRPYDSAMYKVRQMYISAKGQLVIGNYTFELSWNAEYFRINENTSTEESIHSSEEILQSRSSLKNRNIKLITRKWKDGSEAVIDTRGLLHLKSSDPAIPEITIVLVVARFTACWASDGVAAGDPYFIDMNRVNTITAKEFYDRYIQRFIDRITQS